MARKFYGSINFDLLMAGLKTGQLKTFQGETGKRYINIDLYLNDEPDRFGNVASLSVPFKKEFQTDTAKRIYIANLKENENQPQEASFENDNPDNLPF